MAWKNEKNDWENENLEDRIMNDSDGKKGKLLSDALTNHTKDNLYWGGQVVTVHPETTYTSPGVVRTAVVRPGS